MTGKEFVSDGKELIRAGQRILNLERVIAAREGRSREQDTLADYLFTKTQKGKVTGPGGKVISVERKLDREKFEGLKDEYYRLNGWDPATGRPRKDTLESLGLKEAAALMPT